MPGDIFAKRRAALKSAAKISTEAVAKASKTITKVGKGKGPAVIASVEEQLKACQAAQAKKSAENQEREQRKLQKLKDENTNREKARLQIEKTQREMAAQLKWQQEDSFWKSQF